MWEDVKNKEGGRWLFNLDKRDRKEFLDSCWLETVSNDGYRITCYVVEVVI